MRKRIPISLLTILLCFYNIYNGELAFAQSAQKAEVVQTVKDTRYTVTPVDEEWKNLKTHADMVAVCQLPDEFVENASTEELFDAVMEYPMMFDLFCYDTLSIGIEEVTKQFNGLHELLQREDFAKILKEKYQEQEIPKAQHYNYNNVTLDKQDTILQDKSTREKVYRDFYDKSVSLLEEALFTQKGVFEQYSALEQKEIIFEVLDKMDKREASVVYDYSATSEFIELVYITDVNYDIQRMVEKVCDMKIADFKADSISTYPFGATTLSSKNETVYVKTPNGTKVKCIRYANNKKNSNELVLQTKNQYPSATVVENGYSGNNCHAYAWAGRQDIWMNDASAYISDGSYKKINGRPTANGQKAVWGSGCHSGIVMDYTKADPMVTSKWMGNCIVRCPASITPFLGTITYYKRNKSVC